MIIEKISVYGLGKLGSSMLACFAEKGWTVIGVDINDDFVDKVNNGNSPIYELGIENLIKNNISKISATTDGVMAAMHTDASFIIVPSPSNPDGSFTTKYVFSAAENIARAIKNKPYHLVIVTSTVMPGETEKVRKRIEEISGKKCGIDFGLCYNPDFIALGKIIHDFINPDMVLIGESDKRAGDMLEEIHWHLTDNDPEINRMNFWNAELAKITLNAYCTMKISFANTIAEVCEKLPGGDASKVLNAVGADTRVGKRYFRGGLAFSGPCFPRDNRAFSHVAERNGVKAFLARATDTVNEYQKKDRIPQLIMDLVPEKKISILGLTYKEDTNLVEESASMDTIKVLLNFGYSLNIYDPAGMIEAMKGLPKLEELKFCNSIEECLKDTSLCFVAVPWQEFKDLGEDVFIDNMKDAFVLDACDIYLFKNIKCYKLGKN